MLKKEIWLKWSNRKPCPTCDIGVLNSITDDSIEYETNDSRIRNSRGGSFKSEYIFSVNLKCSNCKEKVAVIGDIIEEKYQRTRKINPIAFYPAPKIIHIPNSCPEKVKCIYK